VGLSQIPLSFLVQGHFEGAALFVATNHRVVFNKFLLLLKESMASTKMAIIYLF
jgi:hypothetical protein